MSRLLIQLTNVTKSFGHITIFDRISLSIHDGEIYALVGENGAGKSTLLKLLLEGEKPDLSIGFLPQEIEVTSVTARTFLETGILSELEEQMAICLEDPGRLEEWGELHERYEKLGGYRKVPIEKVLAGLKLGADLLDLPMPDLSSGQRVRVALAKAIIENPDLLLLDEPTNHLDGDMLKWLEEALQSRSGATVIVSHDRKFINTICNRVIEIHRGKLTTYGGNYDFYLAEREKQIERQIKAYEAYEEEKSQLRQKIKALTFSKAKATGPTDRDLLAYDRRGGRVQKQEAHALSELKLRLEKLEENPLFHPRPKSISGLHFAPHPLSSHVAIELEDISKSFGNKILFSNLSKSIQNGDRMILKGPNGSGKTTLLRCILGQESIDSGKIRIAPSAKIAYLDQEIDFLPLEKTPLEYFESKFQITEEELRRRLHQSGIGEGELIRRPFSSLSVGQRKRLMLLSLILENPNVLLLDEPTNHIDLLTMEAFESALLAFEGAILAISHDSTFIEKIGKEIWKLTR